MNKNNKWKLIHRLKALSKSYQDIADLWNQWHLIDTIDSSEEENLSILNDWNTHDFHKEDDAEYFVCLCSHNPIVILNLMKNLFTKERCIIGSCCIRKFATQKLKKELKIKTGEKEGKRYCKSCVRKLPDTLEHWKTYHKKCYKYQ